MSAWSSSCSINAGSARASSTCDTARGRETSLTWRGRSVGCARAAGPVHGRDPVPEPRAIEEPGADRTARSGNLEERGLPRRPRPVPGRARAVCARLLRGRVRGTGLKTTMVQGNHSMNHERGTIRGLHYQASLAVEAKLFRCTRAPPTTSSSICGRTPRLTRSASASSSARRAAGPSMYRSCAPPATRP
jgi:hypothetical protein